MTKANNLPQSTQRRNAKNTEVLTFFGFSLRKNFAFIAVNKIYANT